MHYFATFQQMCTFLVSSVRFMHPSVYSYRSRATFNGFMLTSIINVVYSKLALVPPPCGTDLTTFYTFLTEDPLYSASKLLNFTGNALK